MSRKARNKKHEANGKHAGIATATPPGPVSVAVKPPEPRPTPTEHTWLEEAWRRMSRILGSLQIAVILLASFAAVLAVGTIVESRYTGRIAQEIVYRTWWFAGLLTFLGVNILFAALKKWPWQRHQTGFLITHLGLLTMLAGGIWNAASGTDAQLVLLDTTERSFVREYGYPNSTQYMQIPDEYAISVRRGDKKAEEYAFHHGSFAWRSDDHLIIEQPVWLSFLQWLANPFPKSWSRDLGDGAQLIIENVYPHARREPFSPISADHSSFPAVKVQLWSERMGRVPGFWVALSSEQSRDEVARQWAVWEQGPAVVEFVGQFAPELLDEFLKPPPPERLGTKGQLAVVHDGRVQRIPVEENLGRLVPLGDGGNSIRITKHQAFFAKDDVQIPVDPAVFYEFHAPGRSPVKLIATARLTVRTGLEAMDEKGATKRPPVDAIYHPPDYRFGRGERVSGLLQFAQATDGTLFYRSFRNDAGAFRIESAGRVMDAPDGRQVKSEQISMWAGMKWRFQVLEYLPHAIQKERFVPENARPGLRRADLMTALRCKLKTKAANTEFWICDRDIRRTVRVGEEDFELGFRPKQEEMGFAVKLLRAEQRVDEGTDNAATYTSFVQVTDDGRFDAPVPEFARPLTNFIGLTQGAVKADGEDQVITMNEPLSWRGYKLYMNSFLPAAEPDSRGRPVNIATLTVGRDPGLFLKYLGSSMLALGIACMFYMKAYLFRPRGRALANAS